MDQENNDNTMHEPMGDTQSPVVSAQQSDSAQGQQAEATQTTNDGISDHKMYAILGYILPFLFFLPLLSESSKNNPFARFHANQQLILLIILAAIGENSLKICLRPSSTNHENDSRCGSMRSGRSTNGSFASLNRFCGIEPTDAYSSAFGFEYITHAYVMATINTKKPHRTDVLVRIYFCTVTNDIDIDRFMICRTSTYRVPP